MFKQKLKKFLFIPFEFFLLIFLTVLSAHASLSKNAFPLPGLPPSPLSFGHELGLSPFWDWKEIQTDHFRITFPEALSSIAQKAATALEEAHRLLAPRLRWTPAHRTQVLLIDNTDMANGMASPALRFGMVFFVTPPDNWSSISHYDDWLRLLAIHEYTHYLNMDPTHGWIWKPLRILFGDVFLPNTLWPVWMLEGLAVYMETTLTKAGRGRGSFYEMILRAAVETNTLDDPEFITLDKINGPNPYFPGGETPYLFGYFLMKEIASHSPTNEEALGELSERSSHRIPFFINGNLENTIQKDWFQLWEEWVKKTKTRIEDDLSKIRSQKITPTSKLASTPKNYEILGLSLSPHEKLLAYTQNTLDRRSGLYIHDLETGKTERLCDKIGGVGMAFTPDSEKIIFSALNRQSQYYFWSDLLVFDLKKKDLYALSQGLRAKDPDVSRDGSTVVFSLTEKGSTHIALATLQNQNGRLSLNPHQILYQSKQYDTASTPKFSPDGKQVVFSLHQSGRASEEIIEIDLMTKQTRPLVQYKSQNRFPAFDPSGNLYFVSDRTGVDNLYYFKKNPLEKWQQVTNVTTGLWLPVVGAHSIYVSEFSKDGWNLVKISKNDLSNLTEAQTQSLTLQKVVRQEIPNQVSSLEETTYPVQNYSYVPSLWPRQWAPLLLVDQNKFYLGGEVAGFDATDRHQYLLQLGYDTEVQEVDWQGIYSNRSLGPQLAFSGGRVTQNISRNTDGVLLNYVRKTTFSTNVSFPIRWTYSSLTPFLAFNTERELKFSAKNRGNALLSQSKYIPSTDFLLFYSNSEGSRLGITSERGRDTTLGGRLYLDSGKQIWKALFTDTEHFPMGGHSVLVPSVRASYVSSINQDYPDSNVKVSGRRNALFQSLPNTSLDQLMIRGYPEVTILARTATIGALDWRFPLARIFRGIGTHPLFFENLFGFIFGEAAYFPTANLTLPSVGGGIRLAADLFLHIPLTLSVEYHHGFRKDFGGIGEYFVGVNLSHFEF